jgi:hypothetical protein
MTVTDPMPSQGFGTGKRLMLYKDYLNAARKHEHTCDVIYEKITTGVCSSTQEKCLLLNLYYLSGYIIECIIKYAIYDLIGYKKDEDIKNLNHYGLTYHANIRHHKFARYSEHVNRYVSGRIPLVNDNNGIDKAVIELYRQWDSDLRYGYSLGSKDTRHYKEFYKYSKQIYKIIRQNVRG